MNGTCMLFSATKQLLSRSQSPEWNRPALLSEKTNTVSIDICETYHSGFERAPHLCTTKVKDCLPKQRLLCETSQNDFDFVHSCLLNRNN